jgi:hypothetical protein
MIINKFNKLNIGMLVAAVASGVVSAAGPVGVMPYDGDGSGNGFTIDHPGFDPGAVTTAPCPPNSVCTNGTATSADDNLLMREVHDTLTDARYLQLIFHDADAVVGNFTYEAAVSAQGAADSIGAKQVIDDPDEEFYASHAMYHGALFGDSFDASLEMVQQVGGFQTFTFETYDMMEPDYDPIEDFYMDNFPYDARAQIVQYGAGNMADFSHTIVRGEYQPVPFGEITIDDQSIMITNEMTATWIGAGMSGGGPGVLLADGQTQNHDTRLASQRDFGLLIYRSFFGYGPTDANAGGTPDGILNPYFAQPFVPLEIRAFSLQRDQNDSGLTYNTGHGAFVGGAGFLDDYWRDDIFGESPY